MSERGHRRREAGIVVSDKGEKTIKVVVKTLVRHPTYGKYVFRRTNCFAHDEKNEAHIGDRVEIMATRPVSRKKRWRLVGIIERAEI